MARINILNLSGLPWMASKAKRTHEGAPAKHISAEQELRRSVLACMLWEDQFYEDGVAIAGRIRELVPKVAAEKVAALKAENIEVADSPADMGLAVQRALAKRKG